MNQSSVVTEFTFYLGIPVMFGASALKIFKFIKAGQLLSFGQLFLLLVAMGVAFAVSMVAIRFLTSYVKKHDFTLFGKYRIVLGSVLLLYSFCSFICIRKTLKGQLFKVLYSMKIKEQTRKLAAGCSKHCFEVADRADVV